MSAFDGAFTGAGFGTSAGGAGIGFGGGGSVGAAAAQVSQSNPFSSLINLGQLLQSTGSVANAVIGFQDAEFQADIAKRNRRMALLQGAAQERRLRRDRARRAGQARAQIGASGIQFKGTPLDVLAEEALVAEEDALLVRFGAQEKALEQDLRQDQFKKQGIRTAIGEGVLAFGPFLAPDNATGLDDFAKTLLGRRR